MPIDSKSAVWLNPERQERSCNCAVFADRDGTLLEHVDYLGDPEHVTLLPGVKRAIHRILCHGVSFFLLTNQSGVGRGYYTLGDVHRCNERMFELLEISRRDLSGYAIATGLPDGGDPYRKPSPRFVREALRHVRLEPCQAHMIGDAEVDLETARNAGTHAWLVGNGKPQAAEAHRTEGLPFDYTFKPDFPSCIDAILPFAS